MGSKEKTTVPFNGTPEQEKAMQRGTFIHKLLQHLPDIAPEKRADFIKKMTKIYTVEIIDKLRDRK